MFECDRCSEWVDCFFVLPLGDVFTFLDIDDPLSSIRVYSLNHSWEERVGKGRLKHKFDLINPLPPAVMTQFRGNAPALGT